MSAPKFMSRSAARAAGWFSRRHQTDWAHKMAQQQRAEKYNRKMLLAAEQNAATAERKKKVMS